MNPNCEHHPGDAGMCVSCLRHSNALLAAERDSLSRQVEAMRKALELVKRDWNSVIEVSGHLSAEAASAMLKALSSPAPACPKQGD